MHDERTCPDCSRVIEETGGNYLPPLGRPAVDEPRTGLADLLANRQMPDNARPDVSLGELRALWAEARRESLRLARDAVAGLLRDVIIDPSDPDPEDVVYLALAAIDRLMDDPA